MDWTNIEKNWDSFRESILMEWDRLTYESIETMGDKDDIYQKNTAFVFSQ